MLPNAVVSTTQTHFLSSSLQYGESEPAARPWSKYSEGSSKHDALVKGKGGPEAGAAGEGKDGKKGKKKGAAGAEDEGAQSRIFCWRRMESATDRVFCVFVFFMVIVFDGATLN